MSEIEMCEGVWRNRAGQRLVITQCKPDLDGQQWTDGSCRYSDDGIWYGRYNGDAELDLVECIGPLPTADQTAEVERLQAEIERLQSEIEQLQADQAADEQRSEVERAAYLAVINALWEVRS